ncbi:hypothetical protein MMC30_007228 [Trapelia coarctata]|nr:hypothetical protein [Trapelia coarctata]
MSPFFTNLSCDPFTSEAKPCTLGNYVDYAVNVTAPADISEGIAFAKRHNIRLVVRNTGHDYLGKSTGAGSLALWTHHLKHISFLDYNSPHYTGKAIKMGAGVQGFEAYAAASLNGLAVLAGQCRTVGLAGGYTQGAGHSFLSSRHGLAADQALEWEVIDGTGHFLRASRTKNADLFWALSGGGGGTYGVVWSLTSKAHPDIPVSRANLTFTGQGISMDIFYKGVSEWHAALPKIVDAGAVALEVITSTYFSITPIIGPGISAEQLKALLKSFTDGLSKLGITYLMEVKQFPSYLSAVDVQEQPVGGQQTGGRLLPRSVITGNSDGVNTALRNITEDGAGWVAICLNASKAVAGDVDNAVLPAWRDALLVVLILTEWNNTAPLSDMIALQRKMTYDYIPQLTALSPGSGAYLNEGDFLQPNWQETFYGVNYKRLRAIKAKYDPHSMFYATTAVGSDEWVVASDGRLCKLESRPEVPNGY